MNTCETTHEEIVFEGRRCPLCIAMDEIARLEADLARLEADLAYEKDN